MQESNPDGPANNQSDNIYLQYLHHLHLMKNELKNNTKQWRYFPIVSREMHLGFWDIAALNNRIGEFNATTKKSKRLDISQFDTK